VIVPDLLFFCESTSNRASPGLALQVEALSQLLDRLDVTQTDLIGCSYGGFVAQAFASESPERVRRLVLGDSPGSIFERTDYDYILDRYGIASLDELLLPASSADVRRLLELAWHTPPRIPGFLLADARRELYFAQLDEKRALLTDLVSHMGGADPLPDALWPRTLLVWGAHDAIFPVALAERVQRAWSGARLVVIPNAGHAPQIERPRLFNDTVQRFISGPVSV
jgi:pimeloyl-ACP methyl ester carboxylesterase